MRTMFGCAALLLALSCAADAALVIIDSAPRGAEAKIDDTPIGKTPRRVGLNPGKYRLELKAANHETHVETLVVGRKLVHHVVKLRPVRHPVDVFFKNVDETGWAIYDGTRLCVSEDGKLVRVPATAQLPYGKHKIALMKEGFENIVLPVDIRGLRGQTIEVSAVPKAGKSDLEKCKKLLVEGEWFDVAGEPLRGTGFRVVLNPDGSLTCGSATKVHRTGTWEFLDGKDDVVRIRAAWGYVVFEYRMCSSVMLKPTRGHRLVRKSELPE